MSGWINDTAGNARLVSLMTAYNAAGQAKPVTAAWVYDAAGNRRQFIATTVRWVSNFSGPDHTCGGKTGPCASVITASCYTPMGSMTLGSGTPPAASFRLAHAKNASGAAGDITLWFNQGVVDPYILSSRIVSLGAGMPENAVVTVHAYDSTVASYGYVFGPITRPMDATTLYALTFAG